MPAKVDDDRTMLYFCPRRTGSGWSRPNKMRIAGLEQAGHMTKAGRQLVDAAKLEGSWSMLDHVEDLVIPDDLGAALDAVPGARRHWDAFPRSVRRGILEWIVQARRPATRGTRITETATRAGDGERAHQWHRDGWRWVALPSHPRHNFRQRRFFMDSHMRSQEAAAPPPSAIVEGGHRTTPWTHVPTLRGSFGVRQHGGDGPVVLCVHGFPDDASTFDGLAGSLAGAGYRVVAVNLRGYAPSPLDGSLDLDALVEDLLAVVDALSPDGPVGFIGHDYGAQLAYAVLARNPHRFRAAVLLAGAHPAVLQRNARRSPRQLWMSRYIVFFQLGSIADRRVARNDFAYVERLWRRWAPGFTPPTGHLAQVKRTLAASMPAPVGMYRGSGFSVPEEPIAVPTLFVCGADDGCALPSLADGQETLFTADYRAQRWEGTGHFPHLEHPARTADAILGWLADHGHQRQPDGDPSAGDLDTDPEATSGTPS